MKTLHQMSKLHKSIKSKREDFLKSIIDQFSESDEDKTILNCFVYVGIEVNLSLDVFLESLTGEEKEKVQNNINGWFPQTTCLDVFNAFVANIEYQDKFKK